ncbi:MAG TPA: peptidase domain-containing ABC transporter [Bacteroidales bacterium]|nr:peptidase domain-containing ABC transporter [Bacteroidales bacterium]
MARFPFYEQHDAMDCGPACLRMVAKHHGRHYTLQSLREFSHITREGVSLLGISDAAEAIGMRSTGAKLSLQQLLTEAPKPCIVHWRQRHFVVVYRTTRQRVYVADPAHGLLRYSHREFLDGWASLDIEGQPGGIALLLEPRPEFYEREGERSDRLSFRFLLRYLRPYRKLLGQLALGVLAASVVQLLMPFLTQSIVDIGITNQDISFIHLILVAQLMLFFSRTAVEFIRGWILLHISSRLNIALISDFLAKLMRLPIRFFDSRMVGDLMQRIADHRRVEAFLTSSSLHVLFSGINLIAFGIVLAVYDLPILFVFLGGSVLYVLWITLFMRRRRKLDFQRFERLSDNQNTLIQLLSGMQEIKLHGAERVRRWEWERIQAALFRLRVRSLSLEQYQQAGAVLINETKNILVTVMAATAVVDGSMTLGMMLAVQYIIGQLNGPVEQLIAFMLSAQDARISLERLAEVHTREDEVQSAPSLIHSLPAAKEVSVRGLSFQYEGPHSPRVLDHISFSMPEGSVTAVVGPSGSGKSTLLKLLLGFYAPGEGEIRVGGTPLPSLDVRRWREACGVVMQDGFIFSDTILKNVAVGEEDPDSERFMQAAALANVRGFAERLPLGYHTRIGSDGLGLSQGQVQRILIARALYKQPAFLFMDEATNALDATNEREIMERMREYFRGRTVLIIAHRLSTVRHADQILLLEEGRLSETGTHEELVALRGGYYRLIRNQLELGT